MLSELWLLLMFEESIMKNIVIDVDFPHLWLNSFSHPLLQTLSGIISLLPYPVDAGVFDKLGKLERALMYASLVLKIPSLMRPMLRHKHRIPNLLKLYQKQRVGRCNIPILNQVRPVCLHLKIKYGHPRLHLNFLFGNPFLLLLNFLNNLLILILFVKLMFNLFFNLLLLLAQLYINPLILLKLFKNLLKFLVQFSPSVLIILILYLNSLIYLFYL